VIDTSGQASVGVWGHGVPGEKAEALARAGARVAMEHLTGWTGDFIAVLAPSRLAGRAGG
jgi:hypothetical protein